MTHQKLAKPDNRQALLWPRYAGLWQMNNLRGKTGTYSRAISLVLLWGLALGTVWGAVSKRSSFSVGIAITCK